MPSSSVISSPGRMFFRATRVSSPVSSLLRSTVKIDWPRPSSSPRSPRSTSTATSGSSSAGNTDVTTCPPELVGASRPGHGELGGAALLLVRHAGAGELRGALRQQRGLVDRAPLDLTRPLLPVRIGDGEARGVAVPEQVEPAAVGAQRVVHRERRRPPGGRARGEVRRGLEADRGGEARGLAGRLVGGREVVDAHAERLQVRAVHAQACAEGVVAEDAGVAELPAPGQHDDLALVAEQLPERERDEQAEQAQVEHEVADVVQVATFGRDGPDVSRARRTTAPASPAAGRAPAPRRRRPARPPTAAPRAGAGRGCAGWPPAGCGGRGAARRCAAPGSRPARPSAAGRPRRTRARRRRRRTAAGPAAARASGGRRSTA